ncbi:type IX secretion system protein PorQ, partial [uncultured Muribaculum sp.]
MKRNVIAFIVAILSAVNASAFDDVSTAYSFLDITSSSHVYGLGGVNVSLIDDDINIVEQNPALLGPELGSQLGVNYMRYIGSSNFAGVKYGHSAGTHGAWAASMQYFGYGEMKSTDVTGSVTGTFSPKDICFSGTYSHDITTALRGGVTLKGVYSDYEAYSAFALAVDLGLNYYDGDNDMSLSLVVTNLGGQLKRFNEVYERLPVDVRIGWSQGLHGLPFRL